MSSMMRQEILASSERLSIQLQENLSLWQHFAELFKQKNPDSIVTVARGSSDHAALFAKYLFETELLLPTSSAAPSVYSIYKTQVKLSNTLTLAISQSGQSPDILEVIKCARAQNALTLALANDAKSPLAQLAECVIPLQAEKEIAVAATKSFLLTLTALIHGVTVIKNHRELLSALQELPQALDAVFKLDPNGYLDYFDAPNALILGRGFGFSVAAELALKFKEVTQIHAEAFSSAEVLHGPFSLFSNKIPVLAVVQNDACLASTLATLEKIKALGIEPLIIASQADASYFKNFKHVVFVPSTHALLTPVLACAYVYLLIEALAHQKGLNPDEPPLIQKVTRTR